MEVLAPRRPSLRRNFIWTLAGNFVYAISQWGMLIVLAKLGSPEAVGLFALGLAITGPIFMFTNLQLRTVFATDASGQYRFSEYIGLRVTLTTAAVLVVFAVALVGGYRSEAFAVIVAIAVARAIESSSDILYGLLQSHERLDLISRSLIAKGPFSLVALGLGIYFFKSVAAGACLLGVAWASVFIAYDVPVTLRVLALATGSPASPGATLSRIRALRPNWSPSRLWGLAKLALPLGVVMALISFNTNLPRYFVAARLGERGLGIFAAMAYLMIAGTMVVNALGQSASPRLARYYAQCDFASYRALLHTLLAVGLLLGVAAVVTAWLAGRWILAMLYRPEYAAEPRVLVALMTGAAISFVASFLGYGVTAARLFRVQVVLFAAVTGVSLLSCAFLVPRLGLFGAGLSTIPAALTQLILYGVVGSRAVRRARTHSSLARP